MGLQENGPTVSAGRSSDLVILGCEEPHFWLPRNPTGLQLVPRSLTKQDRASHNSQDIFVPAFTEDRLLDPVRVVKLYLKRIRDRQGVLDSLFVIL